MAESFETLLAEKKELVWHEIKKYLSGPAYPPAFKILRRYQGELDLHRKMVKEYPERKGKYLRPTLLLLTAEAMSANQDKALKTAAAMQVSEEWLLVHDDVEDGSLIRRGKPTLHRLYGNGLAINAGDSLQVIMWKILRDNEAILGAKLTFLLIDEFYRMLTRTALGQSVELKWVREGKNNFSDDDWFFVADGKTGYYTIAAPMRLGAIIAGANRTQLNLLAKFGVRLGRSFQLIDDVLDLTSDFGGLKDQAGNDIYEGKRTVLYGHVLRTASFTNRKKIRDILDRPRQEKTQDEVNWVIKEMRRYGSIEYAKNLARSESQEAREIFEKDLGFLSNEPARRNISLLVDFVTRRKY